MSDSLDSREYERRFLVSDSSILNGTAWEHITQTYLWSGGGYAVRVRVSRHDTDPPDGGSAWLTFKGPRTDYSRYEVETPLDLQAALAVVGLGGSLVVKRRHHFISEHGPWVVDVFDGANEGLMIAEFEASEIGVEILKRPWWAGDEITRDSRFNNEQLALRPWREWRNG